MSERIAARRPTTTFVVLAVACSVSWARSANADESCTALVSSMTAYLETNGGQFVTEMSIHRSNIDFIDYSRGALFANTCEHNECQTGDTLDQYCDPCVAQICDADPYCCQTAWDSLCVGEVTSICGQSCSIIADDDWVLRGWRSAHLFSSRYGAGGQPFDMLQADQIALRLSSDGVLHLWDDTWNFATQWDLTCTGNIMSTVVPGYGVVTFTFRHHEPPIF